MIVRVLHRSLRAVVVLVVLALGALMLFALGRGKSQDLPWTPLDLAAPVGLSTRAKLVALTGYAERCADTLREAGVRLTRLPPRGAGQCVLDDGVRLLAGGARAVALAPAGEAMSCPVATALTLWEWQILQPAALRRLGSRVAAIEHYGSQSCRRLYGRSTGAFSEHATGDAIDIAGFRLADGRRITVLRDWTGNGAEARFLREARDGACELYATVLSPDYNAAHRDHFHLDQAERGRMGWGVCR